MSFQLSKNAGAIVEGVLNDDYEKVEFGKVLDGSNSLYEIRPTFAFGMSGQPYSVYGVFNVETGVMETESRQIAAAKEWVVALTAIAKGEELPMNVRTLADAEEEEEEDAQHELPLH